MANKSGVSYLMLFIFSYWKEIIRLHTDTVVIKKPGCKQIFIKDNIITCYEFWKCFLSQELKMKVKMSTVIWVLKITCLNWCVHASSGKSPEIHWSIIQHLPSDASMHYPFWKGWLGINMLITKNITTLVSNLSWNHSVD